MVIQKSSAIILLTCIATALSGFFAYAVLVGNKTIPNNGHVKAVGVGVYWENSCINDVDSIGWGYLDPGTSHDVTVYVRNEGTVPMTLSMSVNNWNPSSASTYITVSWNREGQSLDPDDVLTATITLSVSQATTDLSSFSFDITIVGTE